MSPANLSTRAAAAGLTAIAGLHVTWALGSSWPMRSYAELTDATAGRPAGKAPSPPACLAVAGLLASAAAFVGVERENPPLLKRLGAGGVVATLGLRAGLGFAGRTDLLAPAGSLSPRFRRLDRRLYSPLCLALAALALPATVPAGRRRGR